MLWLALVLFVALSVAVIRGGRISNLGDIHVRFWPLLLLGFGLQAATIFFPVEAAWSSTTGTILVLASYVALVVVVFANRTRPGFWLVGIGVLMNFTVISLNGGMPVMQEAALAAAGWSGDPTIEPSYKHLQLGPESRLSFLADVIPLRLFGVGQVLSLGDIFLAVGLGRFLETELRKPVRWFKKGAPTQGGSASN